MPINSKISSVRKAARFGACGDRLLRQLLAEFPEWVVVRTGRGHVRLTSPSGRHVFIPGTPGDWRTLHNARAQMRRADGGDPK